MLLGKVGLLCAVGKALALTVFLGYGYVSLWTVAH